MNQLTLSFFISFAVLLFGCQKHPAGPSGSITDNTKKDTLNPGWSVVKNDPLQQFTNIRFSGSNGIAVSTVGIFGSADGGNSWQQRSTYGNPAFGTGYAWQRNIGIDGAGNVIVPQGLFNGGAPYTHAISHDYLNFSILPDNNNNYLNDFWFYSNNNGYAITANDQDTAIHFKKTSDGGITWSTISIIPRMPLITNVGITEMSFVNSQLGWIATPYGVYKTTDGGLNWSFQYAPGGIITNISAPDANSCYILYFSFYSGALLPNIDKIAKTTDGGTTWQVVYTNTEFPNLSSIWFVSASTGYLVRGPYIYKTSNGGTNWEKVVAIHSSQSSFEDIFFSDANHGWACSMRGQILKFQ